jgi:hypothetical protein
VGYAEKDKGNRRFKFEYSGCEEVNFTNSNIIYVGLIDVKRSIIRKIKL